MEFKSYYSKLECLPHSNDSETVLINQEEADCCGLAYQVRRYGMDGLAARFEAMKDKFGFADCRNLPNYAEQVNMVNRATEYFDNLPSELRKQYGNDPVRFYDAINQQPVSMQEKGFISPEYTKDILARQQVTTPVEPAKPVIDEASAVSAD